MSVVVEATAFVKHMVRNITGTLAEVGLGRRAADSMPALLASRDRTRAGRTAPPQGLLLERVFYGTDGEDGGDAEGAHLSQREVGGAAEVTRR